MPALESGVLAPEINLSLLDGHKFSLKEALQRSPVVAAFFKISCPVCQFALPYLERMFKAYGGSGKFTLAGISQDTAADTKSFNREYGITFPTLLDEKAKYPASNAYGLTNVPTIFLISADGEIEASIVGWSKPDMEQLNRKLAQLAGGTAAGLFAPGERVPEYKPG
ncbi:MAG TPA: TlpA disulfide reductase family protein [Candidatus Angelobacter sp.]